MRTTGESRCSILQLLLQGLFQEIIGFPLLPPCRWVGVLAAAGSTSLVGIGGRTSSHELPDKLSKVLVAAY